MLTSCTGYTVGAVMTSATDTVPGDHFQPASSSRRRMFDELRKRAMRQQREREQRIDSLVQEQRERQLRSFRRTAR